MNRRKSSLPAGATATASSTFTAKSSTSAETDDTASVTSSDELVPFRFTLTVAMIEIYLLGSGGINGQGGQVGGASLDIARAQTAIVSAPVHASMPPCVETRCGRAATIEVLENKISALCVRLFYICYSSPSQR